MKHIYCPQQLHCGESTPLSDATFHHLFRVIRCRPDEQVVAFNGDGYYYHGTLHQTDKKHAALHVTEKTPANNESPLNTSLIQGLSKSDKMDTAIQKAVELGVNAIYPVRCEYSNVKLDGERLVKKQQHWQTIIIAACEQSERAVIPTLHPLQNLSECLPNIESKDKIALHPPRDQSAQQPLPDSSQQVALLVGPEGGLSNNDLACAESHDFIRLALGSRILRTETATVSALSLAQYRWGDWQ